MSRILARIVVNHYPIIYLNDCGKYVWQGLKRKMTMSSSGKVPITGLPSNKSEFSEYPEDANARLIAMLDASPHVFIIIDQHGKIELLNAAVESMFNYNPTQLLGKNISMLMPRAYRNAHDSHISEYLLSGKSSIIGKGRKLRAVKADGKEFPIFLSVGEVKYSSHVQFVGVISDMSEQEKSEIALAKNNGKLASAAKLSAMVEMAAGIAHEINQPLAAIASFAQASKRMINAKGIDHTKVLNETLEKISEQAIRASKVIERLRTLGKQNGVQRQKVNLLQLILESLELAKIDHRVDNYQLEYDREKIQSLLVFVDPIQIQQVVLNLMRNATDAMEEVNKSEIQIKVIVVSSNQVEISIIDCGIGIDKNAGISIFAPFFTTKENGMGVGLSVCQSIVFAHGGKIYYCANEPQGTKFSFTLPLMV